MFRLFILILLGFSVITVSSRPSQSEENNENQEELEYEEDGSPGEDNMDDSQFGDEDANSQDLDQTRRLLELNRNNYLQKNLAEDQVPRTNLDAPDYKPTRSRDVRNDKNLNSKDEFQLYGKRRRYIDDNGANEQPEMAQHLTNRDINNFRNNRMHNEMLLEGPLNKRNSESKKARTEEGDLLFENERDQTSKVDRNEFIEPADANQRSYPKQYYNQISSDKAALDFSNRDSDFLYYNRERREAKKSNPGDTENIASVEAGKESLEKPDNENEEMAIKRHIRKMSSDELEQLLNSLAEEKRALLKKIMDDDDMSEKSLDNINKREITKKAGAVEDNGYMDSGQSESSKLQGGLTAIDITTAFPAAQGLDMTTNKQPENQAETTVLANQKPSPASNSENKAEFNTGLEKSFSSESDANKNRAEMAKNEELVSKNENKRETNTEVIVESLKDSKAGNEDTKEFQSDDSYFFPRDEDMSQFLDDVEESRTYDSSKIYKREVENQSELDSKLKSLEESFPNSDMYDESGPYTGPLIRVKRKNSEQAMKKRSAAVLPEKRVGYYPSKSDNNDDDSDEGNEFDDDGFYDPSPNLVNNDNRNFVSNSDQIGKDDSCKLNSKDQSKTSVHDGTMNLGSDIDNVLSGVEGVDENLMYNSALRNRRKTDGNFVERVDENSLVQSELSKTSNTETKSNNGINIPNYQDNDSFGGFPRSYEGDLSRYKRVRRLKQSHVSEAPPIA